MNLEPLFAIGIVFSIPLVAILTHHQRKMAEILHRKPDNGQAMNEGVLQELQRLRQLVNEQSLVIEELRDNQQALARMSSDAHAVRERLNG